MPYMAVKLDLKYLDEQGYFEGYAARFNNVDLGGDVIERGAFKKTLNDRLQSGKPIRVFWNHDTSKMPIGVVEEAYEDEMGLYVKGKLDIEYDPNAQLVYRKLKGGRVDGMSIGYETIKEAWEGGIRKLKEIKLWEISFVNFPMNPGAQVTAIKAVVPFQDLPLASEDRSWDADAARARVAKWASSDGSGDKDKIDWGKYRKAFVWYDAKNAENFGAYKLPIADVIDGKLMAVPRAIFAAAAAIQGARGGVNIPDSDIPAIKRHLERYYREMEKEPPWAEKHSDLDMLLYAVIGAAHEIKAGRVLSAANSALVEQAIQALQALLAASEPDKSTQDDKEPPDSGKSDNCLLDDAINELKKLLEVA